MDPCDPVCTSPKNKERIPCTSSGTGLFLSARELLSGSSVSAGAAVSDEEDESSSFSALSALSMVLLEETFSALGLKTTWAVPSS